MEVEKISFEGKVVQKLECRPTGISKNCNYKIMHQIQLFFFLANASYMKLKRDCLIKAAQPTRVVKQLDRVVQSYKPVSDHKHNVLLPLVSSLV